MFDVWGTGTTICTCLSVCIDRTKVDRDMLEFLCTDQI